MTIWTYTTREGSTAKIGSVDEGNSSRPASVNSRARRTAGEGFVIGLTMAPIAVSIFLAPVGALIGGISGLFLRSHTDYAAEHFDKAKELLQDGSLLSDQGKQNRFFQHLAKADKFAESAAGKAGRTRRAGVSVAGGLAGTIASNIIPGLGLLFSVPAIGANWIYDHRKKQKIEKTQDVLNTEDRKELLKTACNAGIFAYTADAALNEMAQRNLGFLQSGGQAQYQPSPVDYGAPEPSAAGRGYC